MKGLLLLFVFTTNFMAANAQESKAKLEKNRKAIIEKEKEKRKLALKIDTTITMPWKGGSNLNYKKPGVYALPQDGMPCIVPYTDDIVAIPNAMPQKKAVPFGKIPNATPQTGEELRQNQRRFFAPPSR